ncbi:hypothetical protein [Modestobacter roseus]|uniref:hypothetical protein n=1 Tax=Modestobacter roseus TaxID=1181884 RepID=UPI001297567F|nr:hypothetical protein [Modestobacter roseus]MQA35298.1 hypothetical protein [Modestobacter roseus]
MTSTPDCFPITGNTVRPGPSAARDRFLALVAEARTAVEAALTAGTDAATGHMCAPNDGQCGDTAGETATCTRSTPAQRLDQVVADLLAGNPVERAAVRVID